jgi:hypothetical protein
MDTDDDYYIGTDNELDYDTFVELSLNSDGYIDQIKADEMITNVSNFGQVAITGDEDEDVVTIDGNTYDSSDVIVFNTSLPNDSTDDDEVDLVDRVEFMDDADDGIDAGDNDVIAKIKDGKLLYLVIDDPSVLGSDNNIAIITAVGKNSDGEYAWIMDTGDAVKKQLKTDSLTAWGWAKGVVINYELSGGELKNQAWEGYEIQGTNYEILDINNKVIKLGAKDASTGTNYFVDSDTLYFDYSEDDPELMELDDLGVGDIVKVYQDDAGEALKAITLIDSDDYVTPE